MDDGTRKKPRAIHASQSGLLVLEIVEQHEHYFLLSVHVEQVACCPECGRRCSCRHSCDIRRLQDLPWQGPTVQILLRVPGFRRQNQSCMRQAFIDHVEGIPSYLRQTGRLAEIVRVVGYAARGIARHPVPIESRII
jgi:transposase